MASSNGILIDLEWCSGCHSCEMACRVEHDYHDGKCGIVVHEIGPWELTPEKWVLTYAPTMTELCDLCATRTAQGKEPTCVKHCQSHCMMFGDINDLAKALSGKPKQALFSV